MQKPYIFNVQRFSTHDGPGLRTTIFFKGCPIRCQWCHNPESQLYAPERMIGKDGAPDEIVGKRYDVGELVDQASRDEMFYDESGGGVTLSGGEVMCQDMGFVGDLVDRLVARGISVGIDTCGVAPWKNYARIAGEAAFYLYDLKFIDSDLHRHYTRAPNRLVLSNLQRLSDGGETIYLRMICLSGINTSHEIIERTMTWLDEHHIRTEQVDLLPYHTFGMDKYARLGRTPVAFTHPPADELASIKAQIEEHRAPVTIGG